MVWLVTAVACAFVLFLASSKPIVVASHDAVLRPTLDGKVLVRTGPILPDFRVDSGRRIGVDIDLGKTSADTYEELIQRYGVIAGAPEGQIEKVTSAVEGLVLSAALRGAILGLVPVGAWLLLGPTRRRQLWHAVPTRRGVITLVVVASLAIAMWEPWRTDDPRLDQSLGWTPLSELVGPNVPLPTEVMAIEVRSDVTSSQTRRLVQSAISTYDESLDFYRSAQLRAAELELRTPKPGEDVVLFVSDRHDNIGMDKVARAIGDRAGARTVFDGGDDTSTGAPWEAFSLDSVTAAYRGYDRYGVTGNHDNGSFVREYLDDRGWTMLNGRVVEGPAGTTLLGVGDPRASGLGDWVDQHGLTFPEVATRLADTACAEDERVTTVLVHDVNLAKEVLERGCAELVLGGHLHVRVGPRVVPGPDGQVGFSFTTGTAGGAVFTIATGTKPRRDAGFTLVTYRDGHPAGLQYVELQTNGHFIVGDYEPFAPEPEPASGSGRP